MIAHPGLLILNIETCKHVRQESAHIIVAITIKVIIIIIIIIIIIMAEGVHILNAWQLMKACLF